MLVAALVVLLTAGGCAAAAPGPGGETPATGGGSVVLADLPPEVTDTVTLIRAGGPFPYVQDGATFHNRERLLPARPEGYYHEYTVVTPGSPDRGARRIVAGERGELYYTDDHYRSFREVTE